MAPDPPPHPDTPPPPGPSGDAGSGSPPAPLGLLAVRGVIGGTLMGLANLVPGISGGTMLLAAGVYPRFITAIGEVTTLVLRRASLVTLGSVVGSAVLAIALLAEPVKDLVVHHRWVMYSLFIGLTLGGVPVVWRLIGSATRGVWVGAAGGLAAMSALALAQVQGAGAAADGGGFLWMLLAGAAAASAMILPGVSGGYLLLVLGAYVPILRGIAEFVGALRAGDAAALGAVGAGVILPVGLGVVGGVVGVSNALRYLLRRFEKPTLGVLLGLLIGAVVGLWPFERPVTPQPGDVLKNQVIELSDQGELVFAATGRPVEPDDYPTGRFTPSAGQVLGSAGLIGVGFVVTLGVGRLGRDKPGRA